LPVTGIRNAADVQVIAANMPNEATATGWWNRFSTTIDPAVRFNAMYVDLSLRVAHRATRPAWRAQSFFAPSVSSP